MKCALASLGLLLALATPSQSQINEGSKEKLAATLMAMNAYVEDACILQKPNTRRIEAMVLTLGYSPSDFEKGSLKRLKDRQVAFYRKGDGKACSLLEGTFGPNGTLLPDLLIVK